MKTALVVKCLPDNRTLTPHQGPFDDQDTKASNLKESFKL